MGLGIGQPEGGYGYAPHGVGHYNGYGQYGHGIYGQGQYGQGQFGQGQYGHGYGGAPFGHGLHHPAAGYAPLGGYGSGFGFRSGDQTNDADAQKKEGSRRRRSDDATVSEAAKESTNGDSAAQGRALANDHQTDPRLLGLFGNQFLAHLRLYYTKTLS